MWAKWIKSNKFCFARKSLYFYVLELSKTGNSCGLYLFVDAHCAMCVNVSNVCMQPFAKLVWITNINENYETYYNILQMLVGTDVWCWCINTDFACPFVVLCSIDVIRYSKLYKNSIHKKTYKIHWLHITNSTIDSVEIYVCADYLHRIYVPNWK